MNQSIQKILLILISVFVFFECKHKDKPVDAPVPNYLVSYADLYKTDPRQANLEWFKNAKYGLFMHYGVYSILEDGEWVQLKHNPPIPVADYDTLKNYFNPKNFDADFITDLVLESGMKKWKKSKK